MTDPWVDAVERAANETPPGAVFCEQCYFYDTEDPAPHLCMHPNAQVVVWRYDRTVTRYRHAETRNAHNDCADYAPWRLTWEWLWREHREPLIVLGALVTFVLVLLSLVLP